MNKTQKEYTASRIRSELSRRLIKCSCGAPNLRTHLRKAAVDGTLEMLPSKSVKETAKQITISTSEGGYNSDEINFEKLFKEPKSYVAAKTAHLLEEKQVEEANAKRQAFADALIDQVFLDKFEEGEEAIAIIISEYPN